MDCKCTRASSVHFPGNCQHNRCSTIGGTGAGRTMHTVRTSADDGQQDAALSDGELIEWLRSRAADCLQKSMTARLAAVLDVVELLLGRGYGRSQVLEILTGAGWHFTADSFDSALMRVRKRRLDTGMASSAIAQRSPDAAPDQSVDGEPSPTPQPAQSEQVSPAAEARNGSGETTRPGFADVFLAQRRTDGGSRWK